MDTDGFGGKLLHEAVAVQTNDPLRPLVNLTVQGVVVKFATITPNKIVLMGPPDKKLTGSVKIIPEPGHPFAIVRATAKKGVHITYRLDQVQENKRSAHRLTVENTRKQPGRYVDAVHLETTSQLGPVIKILVWGHIKDR